MICCKIITNYNNSENAFSRLCAALQKEGKILWAGSNLYFSSSTMSENDIKNLLKDNQIDNYFIDTYDKDNVPHENDMINGWLMERIIENNYTEFVKANKENLLKQHEALTKLNKHLDKVLIQLKKEKATKEEK